MKVSKESIIDTLSSEGFSEAEIYDIFSNYNEYEPLVMELINARRSFQETMSLNYQLNSQYARFHYETYEKFMAVHINSIKISAMKSEIGLMGISISPELSRKVEYLLKNYLLITEFH